MTRELKALIRLTVAALIVAGAVWTAWALCPLCWEDEPHLLPRPEVLRYVI